MRSLIRSSVENCLTIYLFFLSDGKLKSCLNCLFRIRFHKKKKIKIFFVCIHKRKYLKTKPENDTQNQVQNFICLLHFQFFFTIRDFPKIIRYRNMNNCIKEKSEVDSYNQFVVNLSMTLPSIIAFMVSNSQWI